MAFSFALGGSIYRTRWLYHPHRWLNLFAILIKKQMSEKGLYKNYTMQELLDELDVIEAFENPGSAVRVGEITKKQSQLYNTLGVVPPTTL